MTEAITRGEPPYLQIARHYREQIERGELRPGQPLPSVREMADRWHVANTTATRALKTLQAEGLATSRPGAGTVVASPAGAHSAEQLATHLRTTGQFYPPGYYSVILGAEIISAPEQVAHALGLEAGDPIISRRRIAYDESDTPVETSTSYILGEFASLAPDLLIPEPLSNGVLGYLEAQTGKRAELGCDQYAAFPASEQASIDLKLPLGSPILVERHWWTTADGTTLEYSETAEPGDRWRTHRYVIPAQAD
jgi:DNA-binding GntR family transcriptional regulator